MPTRFALLLLLLLSSPAAVGAQRTIVYAAPGGRELALDLHLPEGARRPPLVVWVHGGAWRSGSRANPPQLFTAAGFALASVDYRLSPEAPFPAAVHDIKAALRYLRANAAELGFDGERIAIAGESAGGHLAALVGVSTGVQALEGEVGAHRTTSSAVQAILVYFGASDLTTILQQSTPYGLGVRVPALEQFLGAHPDSVPDTARLASPVYHVDRADPPLLMLHGDRDPQMPINQSHQLEGAYRAAGIPVELRVVYGAAHGGDGFHSAEHDAAVLTFLRRQLGEP